MEAWAIIFWLYAAFVLFSAALILVGILAVKIMSRSGSKDPKNFEVYVKSMMTGLYAGIILIAGQYYVQIFNQLGFSLGLLINTGIFAFLFGVILCLGWISYSRLCKRLENGKVTLRKTRKSGVKA